VKLVLSNLQSRPFPLSHAVQEELKPVKISDDALAFMFESTYIFRVTEWAQQNKLDLDYYKCWQGLRSHFKP
jgi:homogentisate 1,2-dioxygenase